jgi:hypothetical protein
VSHCPLSLWTSSPGLKNARTLKVLEFVALSGEEFPYFTVHQENLSTNRWEDVHGLFHFDEVELG